MLDVAVQLNTDWNPFLLEQYMLFTVIVYWLARRALTSV